TYFLRVRGYFGSEYHYADREISLQVYPQLQVPKPVLTGVSDTVFSGSTVQYRMDANDLEQYQSRIEIWGAGGDLLASGSTLLEMLVPESITGFTVVATISDGNGNVESVTYPVQVLAGLKLSDLNSGKTFSVMLPDVSVAWLAEGRNLRNQEGQLLTTLDADITAMTRVGDRLLVALGDQGLMIVDPAENFMALSFYPLAGEVSDVALNGEKLLAIVDGRLQGFEVSGNWISATPIRDGSATGQALYVDDESALDVNAYKDGFMVLRSGSAIAINSQWQTEPSSEVILEDARTMIRSGGRWYVATNSNRLLSF